MSTVKIAAIGGEGQEGGSGTSDDASFDDGASADDSSEFDGTVSVGENDSDDLDDWPSSRRSHPQRDGGIVSGMTVSSGQVHEHTSEGKPGRRRRKETTLSQISRPKISEVDLVDGVNRLRM